MKKLIVKDKKVARKLENRLIKKGLVVAVCEGEGKSPILQKAHVLIQIKEQQS